MALSKITDNSLNITDLTIADDLTVTDDLLLASDGAIIKFGADADVTLTHVHDTGLEINTKFDMNGQELILDADGDTSITADTDDVIDFRFGGTDRIQFTSAGGIITTPSAGGNVIYNEGGVDSDFRIEAATSDHAFFVRGDDSNIGIGTSTPYRMGSSNQR